MRLRSTTTSIALGLASLTLGLVLMAYSLGIGSEDAQGLVRARVQTAELVAAQCTPAAAAGDLATMSAIIRQVAARNEDLTSAGLRDARGKLVYEFGRHARDWDSGSGSAGAPSMRLAVPVMGKGGEWGKVEFCFRSGGSTAGASFLPEAVNSLVRNPSLRVALFVAGVGFVCYVLYLRRTLRHLDPSSVIPPRVRAMLDALAEGVVVLDGGGQTVLANEAFTRSTGVSPASLMGQRVENLDWVQPNGEERVEVLPWTTALASGHPVTGVPVALRLSGQQGQQPGGEATSSQQQPVGRRVYMVNAAPVLGPDGRVRGALATFDDVTQVEQMNLALQESRDKVERQNVELRRLATTDPLTGCLNRRSFLEQFDTQWDRLAGDVDRSLGCVMIDVDKFKGVNDRFGHGVGDDVLKGVAAVLLASVAGADGGLVCRYGGEEFAVMLPGKNLEATAAFAEQLRSAVEGHDWPIVAVTASVGVATSDQGAADVKELLDQADRALYTSKRTGRNRVTRWGDPLITSAAVSGAAPGDGRATAAGPTVSGAVAPAALQEESLRFGFLALATALAHRHRETAMHSRRVADLCVLAAEGLLQPDEAAQLEAAAMLHDVGKLGVPDSILLKPGKLTDEEWEFMRGHEQLGVDIVAAAGMPPPLVWLVAAHHAKFAADPDEPDRPSGQDIPLGARLLAVADAYDAMTSDRPYRAKMPHDKAAAELRRCVGKQFDPVVVEHFIQAVERARAEGYPPPPRQVAA